MPRRRQKASKAPQEEAAQEVERVSISGFSGYHELETGIAYYYRGHHIYGINGNPIIPQVTHGKKLKTLAGTVDSAPPCDPDRPDLIDERQVFALDRMKINLWEEQQKRSDEAAEPHAASDEEETMLTDLVTPEAMNSLRHAQSRNPDRFYNRTALYLSTSAPGSALPTAPSSPHVHSRLPAIYEDDIAPIQLPRRNKSLGNILDGYSIPTVIRSQPQTLQQSQSFRSVTGKYTNVELPAQAPRVQLPTLELPAQQRNVQLPTPNQNLPLGPIGTGRPSTRRDSLQRASAALNEAQRLAHHHPLLHNQTTTPTFTASPYPTLLSSADVVRAEPSPALDLIRQHDPGSSLNVQRCPIHGADCDGVTVALPNLTAQAVITTGLAEACPTIKGHDGRVMIDWKLLYEEQKAIMARQYN